MGGVDVVLDVTGGWGLRLGGIGFMEGVKANRCETFCLGRKIKNRQTSNISRTKSQNLNVSRLVL